MLFTAIASVKATEFSVYEANYPNVKDYNVNIDEATLVIHPEGAYVEMNLYMTVSYDFNSWFFKNYNELEFLWQFNLPEDAIVHQFWYWIGDSIMQADIMDKWTAELLFNNVSNPVRNPGLLTQSFPNNAGQVAFQLRLFPIMRNEKRRFKIQYLLPGRPTGDKLRVWLPMTQLVSDKTPGINKLKILYKYGSDPYEPKIIGSNVLSSKNNTELQAWETEIPVNINQFVELELPSPVQNNKPFFSTYTQSGQSFYHLAVNPPEAPKISRPRNVLFVTDFNRYNTNNLDGDFMLSYLKESLLQAFNESDSINVIAAYDEIVSGGNRWTACSRDGIDSLFEKVMMRSFPSYNNLLPLISRAADFINTQGDSSEILFLTNTNTIDLSYDARDQLADEVVQKFKPGTKIHFMDLDNNGYLRYNYNNGYYETQMQSFYGRITYPTSGNLFFLRYNSLKQMLYSFLYDEISHYENVEVQMHFQNGYAYNKHLIALHEGYYPMNTPIMQVGQLTGEFPVDITVLGKYRNITEKYTATITENDLIPGKEQIATTWYGGKIQSMLKLSYNPITVADIIDLSIRQSILTPYSGFIIFNPDENHGYCQDCNDETKTSLNDEMEKDSTLSVDVSIFPNPFNPATTISYELHDQGHVKIIVFNILGQKVNELVDNIKNAGKYSVSFDGSKLSSGVYILTVSFETSSKHYLKSKKMILMK